ncbi:hypothetical protein AVEN_52541-1 [Araneus ventricosus]|uniref:Uncharacterized protein n=1 Tax=Araneus ventricosus TaxID=182803 RepID=A0A4Y2KKG2_ARAVE|nr:hypothetical protein AVEN_52541-1 [Araneus ventricosus]
MMKPLLNFIFLLQNQLLTPSLQKTKQMKKNRLHSFNEQHSLQDVPVFEKYVEKTIECQILPVEAAVNVPAAENKADRERTSTYLDEKCSLPDASVLEKYDGKTIECQILIAEAVNTPAAENKADDIKSFVFLDEQCYLQEVQTLPGAFEDSNLSDLKSTADEVVAHEPKFSIAEILSTNEVTKFSIEKKMIEEKPDSPIATILGLPVPTRQAHHILDRDLLRETTYYINILQHIVETNKPPLTEDQRTVYEAVMNLIAEGNGGILFLHAPGGT